MVKSLGFVSFFTSVGLVANLYISGPQGEGQPASLALKNDPEKNYREYCSGCHGDKMEAFVDRRWKHGKSPGDLFKAIKVGYPDEGMPGFDSTFTDEETNDLVEYIITGIRNTDRYSFKEQNTSNIFTTESLTIRLDTVVKGLNVPWGLAFLPDGDMLVTDRGGKMYRVGRDRKLQLLSGVPPVVAEGQGGLMDVVLHPDYKKNRFIYISYSLGKRTEQGLLATTAIARAKLEGNKLTNLKNIFVAEPYSKTRHHYGCRLQFDKKGFLYFTIGDRGNERQNPQNISNDLGKVHRIRDDGSIPSDNPFVRSDTARQSIYSFGHRNPQGAAMHPRTGEIWTNEHGPRGGDEINVVQKAKNYGWPVVSYGINYNGTVLTSKTELEGMEPPLLYWIPSIGPSGMAFVKGNRYKDWEGNLLIGSLRFKYLNLCRMKDGKVVSEEILFKNIGRVRDVRMGPDGYIYMAVESPGIVYRLTPIAKPS